MENSITCMEFYLPSPSHRSKRVVLADGVTLAMKEGTVETWKEQYEVGTMAVYGDLGHHALKDSTPSILGISISTGPPTHLIPSNHSSLKSVSVKQYNHRLEIYPVLNPQNHLDSTYKLSYIQFLVDSSHSDHSRCLLQFNNQSAPSAPTEMA